MTTYALNGLGRIGKLALRPLLENGDKIAFLNDAVGSPEMYAHLLEFDTVHGRWAVDFGWDENTIKVNDISLPIFQITSLSDLSLKGVDVMIDCTGIFKSEQARAPYFEAGAKKVMVSAPVKDGPTANIVCGVNQRIYNPDLHSIITAASCSTNCIAPVCSQGYS